MATRPITDTLRHLRGGEFLDEASESLAELVERVTSTGKPGKLTIEISLKKASMGAGALIVSDKITVKSPKEQPMETIMYPTPENNLVTEDPRQQKLPLRTVAESQAPAKVIDDSAALPLPVTA